MIASEFFSCARRLPGRLSVQQTSKRKYTERGGREFAKTVSPESNMLEGVVLTPSRPLLLQWQPVLIKPLDAHDRRQIPPDRLLLTKKDIQPARGQGWLRSFSTD